MVHAGFLMQFVLADMAGSGRWGVEMWAVCGPGWLMGPRVAFEFWPAPGCVLASAVDRVTSKRNLGPCGAGGGVMGRGLCRPRCVVLRFAL